MRFLRQITRTDHTHINSLITPLQLSNPFLKKFSTPPFQSIMGNSNPPSLGRGRAMMRSEDDNSCSKDSVSCFTRNSYFIWHLVCKRSVVECCCMVLYIVSFSLSIHYEIDKRSFSITGYDSILWFYSRQNFMIWFLLTILPKKQITEAYQLYRKCILYIRGRGKRHFWGSMKNKQKCTLACLSICLNIIKWNIQILSIFRACQTQNWTLKISLN